MAREVKLLMSKQMLKNKKKSIIVTGGAGFIGSHLVRELIELGHHVTVFDDLSRGTLKNLKYLEGKFNIIKKDLRIEKGLIADFEGHEIIFNLAALNTGVDYDLGRTQTMFEDNMLLQMIPLKVAAQTKSVKKFIQISSASVYSRKAMEEQIPTPEDADTSNPEPSKIGYALAKKMGENLAQWYALNTPLQTVISRFINVYGENDHYDEKGHFIPIMIRKFFEATDEVEVFGSGDQKRSFLYVMDAVKALVLLAEKGENGGVYNVDSGDEKSIREVVNMIQSLTGKNNLKIHFDRTKPEGSQRRLLDSSKLQKLGWRPSTSFGEGIEKVYLNMYQNFFAIKRG